MPIVINGDEKNYVITYKAVNPIGIFRVLRNTELSALNRKRTLAKR